MPDFRVLSDNNWRGRLVLNDVDYGLWNRDEINFDSEGDTSTDPELGKVLRGGDQTVDDFDIDRLWAIGRESANVASFKAQRGKGSGTFTIHELDPDTRQPVSSTPLMVLVVQLKGFKLPKGDVSGNDESKVSATLRVQP